MIERALLIAAAAIIAVAVGSQIKDLAVKAMTPISILISPCKGENCYKGAK